MKILALDTGRKTGWAYLVNGNIIESGIKEFPNKRGETQGISFLRFRTWLNEMVNMSQPDVIVYEQAHHRGGAATNLCVGFTTRIEEIAAENEINFLACHTGTLKVFATGKGNASKDKIIEFSEQFVDKIIDDNHADAIALAKWAENEIG